MTFKSNLESNFSWQVVFDLLKTWRYIEHMRIEWKTLVFCFHYKKLVLYQCFFFFFFFSTFQNLWETTLPARFYMILGQIHVNGLSHVIASQNGDSIDYISPLKLGVLQWNCHLFNYWKNKKTIIERFLILLIWNWICINHRKITWLWS